MKLSFVLELMMVNMWKEYSLLWEWEPCACTSLIEPKLSYITELNDTWIQIIDYIIVSSMYTTTTKNKTIFLTLTQSITCTQPSILEEWTHNDILKGGGGGHKAYLILGESHSPLFYILFVWTPNTEKPMPNACFSTIRYMQIVHILASSLLARSWPLNHVKNILIMFYRTYLGMKNNLTNLGARGRLLSASYGKLLCTWFINQSSSIC
jgi:hypothetical protein